MWTCGVRRAACRLTCSAAQCCVLLCCVQCVVVLVAGGRAGRQQGRVRRAAGRADLSSLQRAPTPTTAGSLRRGRAGVGKQGRAGQDTERDVRPWLGWPAAEASVRFARCMRWAGLHPPAHPRPGYKNKPAARPRSDPTRPLSLGQAHRPSPRSSLEFAPAAYTACRRFACAGRASSLLLMLVAPAMPRSRARAPANQQRPSSLPRVSAHRLPAGAHGDDQSARQQQDPKDSK